MKLFDLPAVEHVVSGAKQGTASVGASVELLLASRLLELGHRVALPVADDDGVDMIVNYSTLVQIKSSSYRLADGALSFGLTSGKGQSRHHVIVPHVDIVAAYALDSRTWWFIPGEMARSVRAMSLAEHSRSSKYTPHLEAWHVFDLLRGGGV